MPHFFGEGLSGSGFIDPVAKDLIVVTKGYPPPLGRIVNRRSGVVDHVFEVANVKESWEHCLLDAEHLGLVTASVAGKEPQEEASRPTQPCGRPRMNPSVDDGNPPRPFRHLRMAEHRTPDLIVRVRPPFIRCWFKNRLPPSPTSQVGFHSES